MKRILLTILLISLFAGIASAALTYDETYYMQHLAYLHSGSSTTDPMYLFMNESIGYLEGSTGFSYIYLDPGTTPSTLVEGLLWYDSSGHALKLRLASSTVTVDVAGSSTLDTAYDTGGAGSGRTITATDGAVQITNTENDTASLLGLTYSGNTTGDGLTITMSVGSGDAIEIENTGTGDDIEGTGALWSASKLGVGTFAGLIVGGTDIVMENADTFNNTDDDVFEFDSNDKEDFEIDLTGTNIVKFTSDTSAVTLELDVLDDVNGVGNIYFDSAASQITLAANAAADDLLVQVSGAHDASLDLRSAGTGTDAIKVYASAGGIDMDALDDLNIRNTASTDADDFVIRQEGEHDASLLISSDGTGTDALYLLTDDSSGSGDIKINSGDMLDIDAVDTITIDNSGAAKDISIDSAAGSLNLTGAQAAADAVVITSGGGIDVVAVDDVDMTLTSATDAEDFTIALAGSTNSSLLLTSTGTSNDAISLITSAGGIDLTVAGAAAGEDLDLTSNTAINLTSSEAADLAINIATSNASGQIQITSTDTSDDGIEVDSSGGVDIDAVDVITIDNSGGSKDISIDSAAGSLNLTGGEADAAAVVITSGGGLDIAVVDDVDFVLTTSTDAEDLTIQVDGDDNCSIILDSDGTGADAISLQASAGGIDIDGGSGHDIAVTSTGKSIVLTATESAADAISLVATTSAGGVTINSGTSGVTFSDDAITNVGDLDCDDIISDANDNIVLSAVKVLVVTIDVDDDASTDDFTFDDDAANTTEQGVRVGIIPAWCEIIAVQVRCLETVTGSQSMGIEIGTAADGNQIVSTSDCDTANDAMGTAAGESPEIVASSSAINVFVSGTPGGNWDSLDAGRWAIHILYADYAAAYTECAP